VSSHGFQSVSPPKASQLASLSSECPGFGKKKLPTSHTPRLMTMIQPMAVCGVRKEKPGWEWSR